MEKTRLLLLFAALSVVSPLCAFDLVSVDSAGNQGSDPSSQPIVSPDGRYVYFSSESQLAPEDTDTTFDAYLHDRVTGTTTLISLGADGNSADLSAVASSMTADAKFFVFNSAGSNLLDSQSHTGSQIYLHELETRTNTLISQNGDGDAANMSQSGGLISLDGEYIVYSTRADNLVEGDTGDFVDIFLYLVADQKTVRISVDKMGNQADANCNNPDFSGDGKFVVFQTTTDFFDEDDDNGLNDIYRIDLSDGVVQRVSDGYLGAEPDAACTSPFLSDDGRRVIYRSEATNLLPPGTDTNGKTDSYLFDVLTRETTRVSVDSAGAESAGGSIGVFDHQISGDGKYVVFSSSGVGLVPNDNNNQIDIFRKELSSGSTLRVNIGFNGSEANAGSSGPALSADGSLVAYASTATNLAYTDTNGAQSDVFVWPGTPRVDPNIALRAKLLKKLRQFKKKLGIARRGGKVAKVKKFKGKIKKLKKKIRAL